MSDFTANLQLPYLMPGQAQKHVTVNEALRRIDMLVQMRVESRVIASQPASPSDGKMWILPAGKTGSIWNGFSAGNIAYFRDGTWEEIIPRVGWFAFIADSNSLEVYSASGWVSAAEAGGALLESELANPAAVKGINQNLATASTPSFAGLTLASALPLSQGGTGATTADAARANLGAQAALGYTPLNKAGDIMSGSLQVGSGTPAYIATMNVFTTGLGPGLVSYGVGSGAVAIASRVDSASSYLAYWLYNGSAVGSITTNGVSTTYGTASDGRLKSVVTDMEDVGAIIDALRPCRFIWGHIPDSPPGIGFIAQDLVEVVPEAVFCGDENPALRPGDEGFIQWSVDMSKLVPYLVSELRTLRARVAALEDARA